ncbi:MAG: arylsulfatase [Coraliomargarita sp.]
MKTMHFVLWAFAIIASGLAGARADAAQPNVILIMVDDMGYSDLGCYGGEIQTPNLDRLAQDGMRLRQFYNTGKCHSSRVTLLSGLHSYQAGNTEANGTVRIHNNDVARGVSIAEVLREAGYFTAVSGKWHISPEPNEFGFDRFFGFLNGYIKDYFASELLLVDGENYQGEAKYITDLITDYGIQFIEEAQAADKPFLLYLPYNAPHYPLQAPQEAVDKYRGKYRDGWIPVREARIQKMKTLGLIGDDWVPAAPKEVNLRDWNALSAEDQDYQDLLMATYAGMIDRIDQNVGRIVEQLKATDALDNTLILFFSDNGAEQATMNRQRELFERSIPTTQGDSFTTVGADWAFVSNTPYRFFKTYMHEGGIISPCIAHWPEGISRPKGSIDHENVFHLMDIMPTLVDLCGASYPAQFEGRTIEPMNGISMAPAFEGEVAERDGGIYQMFAQSRAYRLDDWKIVNKGYSRWELYNLAEDPTEQNNLARQLPEKVEALKAMWWQVANEDERLPERLSKPCSDKPARYNRFMMRQGNERVPDLD